jgi:hypothetical protein
VIGSSTARFSHLRPSGLRSVWIGDDLVPFIYVAPHLLNHSLGNISPTRMETGLPGDSPPVGTLSPRGRANTIPVRVPRHVKAEGAAPLSRGSINGAAAADAVHV